jgi:hypothetical protein
MQTGARQSSNQWVFIAKNIVLISLVGVGLFWPLRFVFPLLPSDLEIFLGAARELLAGGDPYQPFLIGASFVYPPTAFLLFMPLVGLSPQAAVLIFGSLSALAYLATLLILVRLLRPTGGRPQVVGNLLLFCLFTLLWVTLFIGQVNGLVLLGLALYLWGISEARFRWLGDLGLAAVILIKMSPALLVLYPLFRRDWTRLARLGIGLVALTLLALLWFGLQPWVAFWQIFPQLIHSPSNRTLFAPMEWVHFNSPLLGLEVSWLKTLFSLVLIGIWGWIAARGNHQSPPFAVLALGVITMTIASSLIWYHHFVFLVIPLLALIVPNRIYPAHPTISSLAWVVFLCLQLDLVITQLLRLPWGSWLGYLGLYGLALAGLWRSRFRLPGAAAQACSL